MLSDNMNWTYSFQISVICNLGFWNSLMGLMGLQFICDISSLGCSLFGPLLFFFFGLPILNSSLPSQAHAASAILNFSENCSPDILVSYLDGIVSKLLVLLQVRHEFFFPFT